MFINKSEVYAASHSNISPFACSKLPAIEIAMSSDRLIQAIGRMERALSRVERAVEVQASAPPLSPSINQVEATSALRSLDALIAELKGASHG